MARYILRELPGIAAVETQLRKMDENWESGASWRPEYDGLATEIRDASLDLFGVDEEGTRFDWDYESPIEQYEKAYREWEMNFEQGLSPFVRLR